MSDANSSPDFQIPDLSYSDENGTLTVRGGAGGALQSFVPFAKTVEVLNRFECRRVHLTAYAGDVVDFDQIKRPDRIRQMNISFFERKIDCQVSDGGASFAGLTDLTVTGKFPKRFFDFSKLPALKLLDVDYQENHLSWQQHPGLLELKVRACSAADLRAFAGMTGLKRLRLLRGSIASLNGIEALPHLDTLFTYSTQKLMDVRALTRSMSLRNLMYEACKKITNWDFLIAMPELRWLNFEVIDSVQFISQLPKLIHVHVAQKILDGDRTPIDQHPSMRSYIEQWQAARSAGGDTERAHKERYKDYSPWRHLIDMDSLAQDLAA
jgi:hypothetical protein